MEQKINVFAYAENVPEDINNMQTYVADSIDHIVADTIVDTPKFSGFAAAKSGPAQVTVASGRLYNNGKVYAKTVPTVYDFVAQLPVAAKRIVIISTWGSEVDTGATPRNVLLAAQSTPQNPVYQPQVLEIVHARVANLGTSLGAEAPDPVAPVIDSSLLQVARVVLTPTGVESVTMFSDNEAPNLADVEVRVDGLEVFEAAARPQLASLASDIARLSNDSQGRSNNELTGRMLGRLAILEAKNGIPSNAADSSADFFLDPATSDLANLSSNCKVEEGVRFADDGKASQALSLFNPLNPIATVANGVLFPAYDPVVRVNTGRITGWNQISSYSYSVQEWVQKMMTRTRIRYGNAFSVCTNSAFWNTGTYNSVTGTFQRNGETFAVLGVEWQDPGANLAWHKVYRLAAFWVDTYEEPYWDFINETGSFTGAQIAESFPVGQDFWLSGVGLTFNQLDSTGSVTVAICECNDTGEPEPSKTLTRATLARSALNISPAKTVFTFPTPVYMQAGKRYAFVVITAANHWVGVSTANTFTEGMFFGLVGGTHVPEPGKHIAADLYSCKFRQTVSQIDLGGLQLSGGIVAIDILAGSIAPSSVKLTYQVQIAGAWVSLDKATVGTLNAGGSLPPLLPFRAVFTGTQDMQPCINLADSSVTVARPKTSYTHFWPADPRTPPSSSSSIRATIRYENFDAAYHTAGAKLLSGSGYTTETSPSSYTDKTMEDGSIERTYVWNLGSAISSYKIKTTGTTTSPLNVFHEAWIKDWVL